MKKFLFLSLCLMHGVMMPMQQSQLNSEQMNTIVLHELQKNQVEEKIDILPQPLPIEALGSGGAYIVEEHYKHQIKDLEQTIREQQVIIQEQRHTFEHNLCSKKNLNYIVFGIVGWFLGSFMVGLPLIITCYTQK